jgi:hypothetical protein
VLGIAETSVSIEAMPDQSTLVKARALRARLRRLTALTSVACPGLDGHALMAQSEREAAPRVTGHALAADKLAPFSGWSLRAAGTPWLIIKTLD